MEPRKHLIFTYSRTPIYVRGPQYHIYNICGFAASFFYVPRKLLALKSTKICVEKYNFSVVIPYFKQKIVNASRKFPLSQCRGQVLVARGNHLIIAWARSSQSHRGRYVWQRTPKIHTETTPYPIVRLRHLIDIYAVNVHFRSDCTSKFQSYAIWDSDTKW